MSINRLPKNRPKIAKNNLGYWQKIKPKIFEFGLVCDLSWPVESGNFFLAHPVYKNDQILILEKVTNSAASGTII